MARPPIILASTSPFRRMLMENAGLEFTALPADIDERGIEEREIAAGATPETVAVALAKQKALVVSQTHPDALVIGSDQTLSLGTRVYHKPADRSEAREHIQSFSGKVHQLNSAVAIANNGKIVWQAIHSARMSVRPLSAAFIEHYLDRAGDTILKSVGAYQLEGLGVQLFDDIDGDYFTIVGLPLVPLLAALRDLGALDA